MSDRIRVIMTEPRDNALPLDVQGVQLRRRAIDLMSEIADVDENTVRYENASETAPIAMEGDVGLLTLWQHNLIGVIFHADGKAHKGVVGPVVHADREGRRYSKTVVERNPFA
ncbi:hypothetical protein CH25_gp58 [Mycobacterium phage EagleEye]|uniref:Uncharacterized protein n=1 Tax=Mycobacterium phage EagleEye TaxID=1429759 RepID=W0LIV2_9CAUD|nr:hypothetical protein CH25_gp58 [Mycobacterium phage EagleEye]AHG23828.1 hypothetical protein PBI_EAGLEEYE_48 [Mycobacterium phage EagleEye]QDK03481.1 hypothetical protein SEA_LUCYEDI_47 [Mycobacterium phage Lucyedi]QNJ55834.1 hypothetical protein SEA_PAINTERBOY_47 [Mycobacterium phage PainterBoy]